MKGKPTQIHRHSGHNHNPREFLRNFKTEYRDDDVTLVDSIEFKAEPPAIRAGRNVFYFCHVGSMEIDTAEGTYMLRAGDTFICPSGAYVRLKYSDQEARFSVLSLTDRIIQSLLNTNMHIWNNIVYVMKERVVRQELVAESEQMQKMGWHFAEMMHSMLAMKGRPFYKDMIYLMLQLVLLWFCARYKDAAGKTPAEDGQESRVSQGQIIFAKFMELLQNEPVKHRPVYYYAEKLCISSKYLSYGCKEISGKSASEYIRNAVVGEIMHYLENTTLSAKEIACRMGFPNLSFFGKYVKTHLGLSPNKYRK